MKTLLFILPVLLLSCLEETRQKEESFVKAVVNGDSWETQDVLNPYIRLDKVPAGDDYHMVLIWNLEEWTTDLNSGSMYIKVNHPFPVTGKFFFNGVEGTLNSEGGVGAFFQGYEGDGSYIDYYSVDGFINITRADEEFVEGTFEFDVENAEGETIEVRGGKFKAAIRHVVN